MRTSSRWSNIHCSVAEMGLLQKVEWAFCPMRRGLSLRSPPRTGYRVPERYATVSITPCSTSASQRRAECPPLPCRQSLALVTASLCFARFGSTASAADMLDICGAGRFQKSGQKPATVYHSLLRIAHHVQHPVQKQGRPVPKRSSGQAEPLRLYPQSEIRNYVVPGSMTMAVTFLQPASDAQHEYPTVSGSNGLFTIDGSIWFVGCNRVQKST
jgi:hypothetical protein